MNLFRNKLTVCLAALLLGSVSLGANSIFEKAILPITNPVYHDLPLSQSYVRPLFLHHSLPDRVELTGGATVPVGGDVTLVAAQLEYAINEDLALIATKDGWVDIDADATLTDADGWADLAAGLKWNFHRDEKEGLAAALRLIVELPTGDEEVLQGNGDGNAVPAIQVLKLWDEWQFSGTAGLVLPFDDDESSMVYGSMHVSYAVSESLRPLLELNYWGVTDEGKGSVAFPQQVGGALPSLLAFEGGDLFNLGSANADENGSLVTLALGGRFRIDETVDLGVAYELPLTEEEASLFNNRFSLDLVYRF